MEERKRLNCPNCGAVIEGCKCAYCGTQFYDLADLDLKREQYLQIRIDDRVYIAKVFAKNISILYDGSAHWPYRSLSLEFALDELKEVYEGNQTT